MGMLSEDEAISKWSEIYNNPNSSPEQRAIAGEALRSLGGGRSEPIQTTDRSGCGCLGLLFGGIRRMFSTWGSAAVSLAVISLLITIIGAEDYDDEQFFIAVPLNIAAVLLGIIGFKKSERKKLCVVGIILACIAFFSALSAF